MNDSEKPSGKAQLSAPQPPQSQGQHFERLLRVEEAAELLGGMHPKTLMRFARNGDVPAIKIGKLWYFRASVLNSWVNAQCNAASSVPTERTL